ncbi:hypothetical protein BSKO_06418 [Bryopsis sp. KO-2023]|nr:hypothetical protein BSKO_06418 [Bryopsis sp. KO-2023]
MALRTVGVCVALIALVSLPTCVVGLRAHIYKPAVDLSRRDFGEASGLEVIGHRVSLLPHRRLLQNAPKKAEAEKKALEEDDAQAASGGLKAREQRTAKPQIKDSVEDVERSGGKVLEEIFGSDPRGGLDCVEDEPKSGLSSTLTSGLSSTLKSGLSSSSKSVDLPEPSTASVDSPCDKKSTLQPEDD